MISLLGGHAARVLAAPIAVGVERSRCLRHRFSRNACTRCITVCPQRAIKWTDKGLVVDEQLCTLCLSCTTVCPTEALGGAELDLAALLGDLVQHQSPVLGCRKTPTEDAHGRLPCLGYIASPKVLLLLGLLFPDGLQINLTMCHGCENAGVTARIAVMHARLVAAGWSDRLSFVEQPANLKCESPALSRREIFTLFRQRSVCSAAQLLERVLERSAIRAYGDKNMPEVHGLLARTIASLPGGTSAAAPRRLLTTELAITERCSGCTGCIGICPTGALTTEAQQGSIPVFAQERCVACGLCAAFCRHGAIHLTPPEIEALISQPQL